MYVASASVSRPASFGESFAGRFDCRLWVGFLDDWRFSPRVPDELWPFDSSAIGTFLLPFYRRAMPPLLLLARPRLTRPLRTRKAVSYR